jgi:hypothetical protein
MALFGVTVVPDAVTAPERRTSSSCWLVAMTIPPPASWPMFWNEARGEAAGGFAPPNQFDQNAIYSLLLYGRRYSIRMPRLS